MLTLPSDPLFLLVGRAVPAAYSFSEWPVKLTNILFQIKTFGDMDYIKAVVE